MAGLIRQDDIDEVRSRINIADIVGDYVTLKSAGRRLDEGPLPVPRGAQPELPRAPAGRFLPLLRLRRGRRRLHLPAEDGPRHASRGRRAHGRAHRLRAALRRRRAGQPTTATAPGSSPPTQRPSSSSVAQLATPEAETGPRLPRRARLRPGGRRALRRRVRAQVVRRPRQAPQGAGLHRGRARHRRPARHAATAATSTTGSAAG